MICELCKEPGRESKVGICARPSCIAEYRRRWKWDKQNPDQAGKYPWPMGVVCLNCGGPIRRNSEHGYCKRNRECRNLAYLATHKKHVASTMLRSAKVRARRRGIPFSITLDDIVVPDTCPVLGIPLEYSRTGGVWAGSPSLDKIVPELGYVSGNVQVLSHKANCMKHNATQEELLKFADWICKTYG